jgi:outer membrane lipoprotein carrier protein
MKIFRKYIVLVAAISVMMLATSVGADELSLQEIGAKLQETYDSTTSFTADFSQLTSIKLSRRERQGSGTLLIKKPGLMRWDYLEPDQQVLISDGESMSMYFAGTKQMIIMPAKEYLQSDVTYAFFAGTGNVVQDFEVDEAGDDYCCGTVPDLKLTPKLPHPQVDFLYLWLNEKFLISRMQIADHYGSITDLTFTNIELNIPVDDEQFKFVPPADTEIVRQ